MKTILFGAALITLLTMSANAGEYSPVWYNYEEVDVGENPNWEELIYIENDTLWVASIDSISYPIQSGKSA
ncbi:MAG: hypothetical protein KAY24_19800, partial [Candidatus Eisenbacteria sp.]|nr:hypothetical protein [Candidatus Eisenbacteria bacterium]